MRSVVAALFALLCVLACGVTDASAMHGRLRFVGRGGQGITFVGLISVRPPSSNTTGLNGFNTWLGRNTNYITVFGSYTNWSAYDGTVADVITNFAGSLEPKVWSLGTNITGQQLSAAAAGANNAHFLLAAQRILADAPGDGSYILIRVNEEQNLNSYPWGLPSGANGTPADYIGAWRQFVTTFRGVSSRFRFIWNPNITSGTNPEYDVTQSYPGDAWVDAIGEDYYYDTGSGSPTSNFNYYRDSTYGLSWQASYAATHHKALFICEYGLNGDQPQWLQLMHSWATTDGYASMGYWDATAGFNSQLSNNQYPNSAVEYINEFGP